MPLHIKAFLYILAMSLVVFALLEKPLTASLMTPEDFKRRRNTWLIVTAAAFLSHSFWVYVFASGVVTLLSAQRDRNPIALYFLLLLVMPNYEVEVPAMGIVNFLFVISPSRLLALLILLPMAFKLVQNDEWSTATQKTIQTFVLLFMALCFVITATANSKSNTLANVVRFAFELFVTIWLPFFVCSRGLRDLRQMREALATWMTGFAVLGVLAIFESVRHWLLYESLRAPLGLPPPPLTLYVMRETDGGGALRAMTTAGHPIVLGYLMGVGLCIWTATRKSLQPMWLSLVPLGALAMGLIVALSRGPWVGAAAGLAVLTLVGPGTFKRLLATVGTLSATALVLSVTPYGEKVLGYLPFVGNVERGTVDYRVKLFEVSMLVFWDHPILGNYEAMRDPRMEQMRQGQGIIDMVNSYLGIGLQYGVVGVLLFAIPFVVAVIACVVAARQVEGDHPSMGITGRALAGAIVVTLVTIATASSIEYIPIVYWPMLGMASCYLGIASRWKVSQRAAMARRVSSPHTQMTGAAATNPPRRGRRPLRPSRTPSTELPLLGDPESK